MKKIAVAGNATLDVFVKEKAEVDSNKVTFTTIGGKLVEFYIVENPPILPGQKYRVNQNVAADVRQLTHRYSPGGGGFNSIVGMRHLEEIGSLLELVYLDVSSPDSLIVDELRNLGIDHRFFFQRDIPHNLITVLRKKKLILKGPHLGRVGPNERIIEQLERVLSDADSLLINSIKDPRYYEHYIQIAEKNEVPVYAVVTASVDRDFVFEYVIPRVRPIFNYDEIPLLVGEKSDLDEQSRLELARETVTGIRRDGKNKVLPIFVTLGSHGAYVAKKNTVIHIKLKDAYAKRIDESLDETGDGLRGAGDVFSGAVTAYDTLAHHQENLQDLVRKASLAAIKHFGYLKHLPKSAFAYTEIPI